jgi:hypothetical protein
MEAARPVSGAQRIPLPPAKTGTHIVSHQKFLNTDFRDTAESGEGGASGGYEES